LASAAAIAPGCWIGRVEADSHEMVRMLCGVD
jgi:hypothetical protein